MRYVKYNLSDPPLLEPEDWLQEPELNNNPHAEEMSNDVVIVTSHKAPPNAEAGEVPSTSQDIPKAGDEPPQDECSNLESEVLEILGEDPSTVVKYGPDFHAELTNRLQHLTTEGLNKDKRKELIAKYLPPSNCPYIGAPALNAEVKAALPETLAKRDKGIETKQSQMASAISCLGQIITIQLKSQNKDNEMLTKLMDVSRLLCDIQHGDSVTRRNFVLFSLKKEMKEHLSDTKIDKFLFGENLGDTIKSAKAVSKSGTELKADSGRKNAPRQPFKPSSQKNLNRKPPAPARRPPPPGAAPGAGARSREPAAPRPPPPPRSAPYRTSSSTQRNQPRRRY